MKQSIDTKHTPEQAYDIAKESLKQLGKLKKDNDDELTLFGTMSYGLQSVKINISIETQGTGSVIHIEATSDDVWEKGAKVALSKLMPSIEDALNDSNVYQSLKTPNIPPSYKNNNNKIGNSSINVEGFASKIFRFNSEVVVEVNEDQVIAKAENGSQNIESKNLDNFSYIDHIEVKLTPIGLAFRILVFGVLGSVILSLFVKNGWGALVFDASFKDIVIEWIAVIGFFLSIFLFGFIMVTWMFDAFLETNLYNNFIKNRLSYKGYAVTIGNKSGNNILFLALEDELKKVKDLEAKINELKKHIQLQVPQQPERPVTQTNSVSTSNSLDDLKKLGELYQSGILTKEEFDQKKTEILNK